MLQERMDSMLDLFVFFSLLCFPLLLFTERILSIQNDLSQRTLPLCLNVKPKCLCSGPCPPMDGYRKEEINTPPPKASHSRKYL